jgi:hypothetical protein
MKKTKIKTLSRQICYVFIAAVLLMAYSPNITSAAPITARSVTIGSSLASASTTYSFAFTIPQATVIKSVGFAACTTPNGACTPAPGFSSASSTLTSQPTNLGDASGWVVSTATPAELRLSKSANVAAPTGSQTVGFSSVINPSATNSTFFLRITTYSDAAWATSIDTGNVASSTAGQITVTAIVDEALTFTLATTTVALGSLTTGTTGTGVSSMTVSTNAKTGYSVAYSGTTLTSGTSTITPLAAATASSFNTKQFGINLMNNTTPAIGSATTGTGSGVPSVGYGTANQFKFNIAGETIASASLPTNSNVFTASYIANIDGSTASGAYSTVLIYTATANF